MNTFLDPTNHPPYNYVHELKNSRKIGSKVVSNLPLQMTLYFNVVFFPFWLTTIIFMLYHKYDSLHDLYRVITTIVLVIFIPMEGFRLYLGYVGNLLEKIPELAGFWMLSLLLQCPLQTFLLLNKGTSFQPTEKAVQSIMFIMLIMELLFGFTALRRIAKHRANNFYLTQLRSTDILTTNSSSVKSE